MEKTTTWPLLVVQSNAGTLKYTLIFRLCIQIHTRQKQMLGLDFTVIPKSPFVYATFPKCNKNFWIPKQRLLFLNILHEGCSIVNMNYKCNKSTQHVYMWVLQPCSSCWCSFWLDFLLHHCLYPAFWSVRKVFPLWHSASVPNRTRENGHSTDNFLQLSLPTLYPEISNFF